MRFLPAPLALLFGLVALQAPAAAEEGEPGAGAESVAAAAPDEGSAGSRRKATRRHRKRSRARARKKVQGHAVFDPQLRAEPPARPSGNLNLYDIARHESLNVNIYLPDGSYDLQAVAQVSHLFRCKRTDAEREIEPRLMTVLSHVQDKFKRRIEVVSAYRNQQRQTSYHYQGSAVDIRVPGVSPAKLRRFLHSLDTGGMGIGLYPRSRFVHVDIRPPPSYRWVDYSGSDPDAPDKRPPAGWKRKKLRS